MAGALVHVPIQISVEAIPFSFRWQNPENLMVHVAEKESTACTHKFDVAYLRQGKGAE